MKGRETGLILHYPGWARCRHKVLIREVSKGLRQRWSHTTSFEDGGRGHRARNMRGLWELERQRNRLSPSTSGRNPCKSSGLTEENKCVLLSARMFVEICYNRKTNTMTSSFPTFLDGWSTPPPPQEFSKPPGFSPASHCFLVLWPGART